MVSSRVSSGVSSTAPPSSRSRPISPLAPMPKSSPRPAGRSPDRTPGSPVRSDTLRRPSRARTGCRTCSPARQSRQNCWPCCPKTAGCPRRYPSSPAEGQGEPKPDRGFRLRRRRHQDRRAAKKRGKNSVGSADVYHALPMNRSSLHKGAGPVCRAPHLFRTIGPLVLVVHQGGMKCTDLLPCIPAAASIGREAVQAGLTTSSDSSRASSPRPARGASARRPAG